MSTNNYFFSHSDNKSIYLLVPYPHNLELITPNLNYSAINFMDANIILRFNKTLIFNIYFKGIGFSFNVINLANFNSCLHIFV